MQLFTGVGSKLVSASLASYSIDCAAGPNPLLRSTTSEDACPIGMELDINETTDGDEFDYARFCKFYLAMNVATKYIVYTLPERIRNKGKRDKFAFKSRIKTIFRW